MSASFYDVLGVAPTATAAVIRAAYKARIRETHPDSGGDPVEAGHVNRAYEVLGDDTARAAYDVELASRVAATQPTAAPAPQATLVDEAPLDVIPAEHPESEPTASPARRNASLLWLTGVAIWGIAAVFAFIGIATTPATETTQGGPVAAVIAVAATALVGWLIVSRRLLWAIAVAIATFLSCGYIGLGGWVNYLLVFAVLAAAGIRGLQRRRAITASIATMDRFWGACQQPGITGWFIGASQPQGQTTLVSLSDAMGDGRPDTSATLWGTHRAGQYIAVDLGQHPAQVVVAATDTDIRRATKAAKRQRNRA